ncbi:MAG: ABC transporter permease [Sporolactobacillus sp.]|jgi:dipeptide transport system permease protein|nr:ABC transporter permease [Sporolactobacillus sp.]
MSRDGVDVSQSKSLPSIPDRWFRLSEKKDREVNPLVRPNTSYWRDTWFQFRKNKLASGGLIFLVLLGILAVFGPMFSPYHVTGQNLVMQNQPPSGQHWFGTDNLGRDVFVRTWYGARISLFIGIVAALIDLLIGVAYGGISGYQGGRIDNVMMRVVEILYGLPYLLVVILLMVVMGPGLVTIVVALSATGWTNMARIVRGQVLQLKNYEFVIASRSFGGKTARIVGKDLIPNTMGPIIVQVTLTVPSAIFSEAFLSFLGLGVQAPYASWGVMVNNSLSAILSGFWWQLFFPALFISLTMFAFNIVGDGLQDALDPNLRS